MRGIAHRWERGRVVKVRCLVSGLACAGRGLDGGLDKFHKIVYRLCGLLESCREKKGWRRCGRRTTKLRAMSSRIYSKHVWIYTRFRSCRGMPAWLLEEVVSKYLRFVFRLIYLNSSVSSVSYPEDRCDC